MTHTFFWLAQRCVIRACIFGALAVAGVVQIAHAQTTALDPSQREWHYTDHADVKTGELYPAAFLMSPAMIPLSVKAQGLGHGYLGVNKHPQRPIRVTVSWDFVGRTADPMRCNAAACQLKIRFGAGTPITFLAVPDKDLPSVLYVQETSVFLTAAKRHVGAIEVEVQTAANGPVSYTLQTARALQIEKMERVRK